MIKVPSIPLKIEPQREITWRYIEEFEVWNSAWLHAPMDDDGNEYTFEWTNTTGQLWIRPMEVPNVDIHSGSVFPDSGSGNSGGEHSTSQGYIRNSVGQGVYSPVSASEHSWVRDAYAAVQQRFRRSGSGDGGAV